MPVFEAACGIGIKGSLSSDKDKEKKRSEKKEARKKEGRKKRARVGAKTGSKKKES
jgi:hypothetical protein